jgi:hypothetical protein
MSMPRIAIQILVCLACLSPGLILAKPPELADLKIYPAEINLSTRHDQQSLVVQAIFADGVTQDVTAQAAYAFGDKTLARLEHHIVYPQNDGQTELKVKYAGRTLTVPVKVAQARVERPVSFKLDVMPVLMKAGCNTGACHGSSRGKDGFRMSLFGYDPDGDYFRLTRESIGRRINLALPEESLLLEKGAGRVPHTGGERFKSDSALYQTVLRWLKAGAPKDAPELPRVVAVEMYPKQSVIEGKGSLQKMTVRASYSDGSDRDITALAVFLSNNDVTAKVSETGVVTAGDRGEAFVMARFESFTVGAQVLVIPKGLKFTFPDVPENNYIDNLVHAKLKKLRITPSELCDDATFLRRVHLDITGTLPTAAETRKFVADLSTGKRSAVVDELLNRKEFAEMWVMKWAELLGIRTEQNTFTAKSVKQYYDWLQEQVVNNVPVNQMVQSLLTAKGGTFKQPAANFYKVETDTLKLTENVAQAFMGMRIQCAQCHNHPFDRWTMNDYYGFAAFFSQVGRKVGEDPRESVIYNRASGELKHPVGGRDMKPKFLGGDTPEINGQDRRAVLAKWLASPENPYFAKNLANVVWAHFLGKGIINEVDDVRVSNPPSNPELLDALAEKFTGYKYDFKKLVRDICNSRTYQLSAKSNETNAGDSLNFAKAGIRRLRAEVLIDCIN